MSSHYTGSNSTEIYLSSLEAMKRNKRLSSLSFSSLTVGNKKVLVSWVSAMQDKNPINVNLPDQGEEVVWLSRAHRLLGGSSVTSTSMISPLKQAGFCSTSKDWPTLVFSLLQLILQKLSDAAVMKF